MLKTYIKILFCLSVILFSQSLTAAPTDTKAAPIDTKKALTELDGLVSKRQSYLDAKLKNVAFLKQSLKLSDSYESSYERYHQLAEQYQYFNTDSAIYYGQKEYECGSKMGDKDKADKGIIDMAYNYACRGDYYLAEKYKNKLGDIRNLQPENQGYLAFVNFLIANDTLAPNDKRREAVWALYGPYIPMAGHKREVARASFLRKYDEHRLLSFINDPQTASYLLSELYTDIADMYLIRHDSVKATYYLTRAASNSIRDCNLHEIAWLQLLDMPDVKANQKRYTSYLVFTE